MSETFSQKIIKLVNHLNETNESLNDCLLQIKTLLISAHSQQIQEVVQQLNITQFFNRLNHLTDNSSIDLIVSVFGSILESLSPTHILSNFQNEINDGLMSKNDSIIELWLKTLNRCFADEMALNNLINTNVDIHSIVLKVVGLLSNPNTSIAKYCHSILLNIAKSNAVQSTFFQQEVQKELNQIKKVDDIVRMRVYELVVNIANISQVSLYRVENCGHLKQLLDDLNRDIKSDPLIALNILQIMTDLGSTSYGAQYLQSSDILKTIADRLGGDESDIFAHLLIPGYVKIFGTLANNDPKILIEHPIVLKKITSLLDESDPTLKLCAIDAIANICLRNEGKKIINKEPEIAQKFMRNIGTLITSGNTDLKTRALNSLSNVLQVLESDPNSEATTFTETWFRLLLPDRTLSTLISLCREPFMEIKLSAIECVRVLASNVWGQKELASFPGFLEYILDRSTESTKNGKEAKYSVVRELVVSPFITLSFTREAIQRLRSFYKEGPYYVENETAVAFEGAN